MNFNPRWANYFDNAATTPLDPCVREAMLPYLGDEFGNANSIHQWGSRAMAAVENAREQVSIVIGSSPELITFTSGATESNNWVIGEFKTGVISPFEHSSVREPALANGFRISKNDGLEPTPPHPFNTYPDELSELQSLMLVNNEIGTRWDPRIVLGAGGDFVHSDITQALGKVVIEPDVADYLTASAHKVYGPKGIGLVATGCLLEPMIRGGEQENDKRAGTLNVAGIVGFGAACALLDDSRERDWNLAQECRNAVLEELATIDDWQINGVPDQEWSMCGSVPHILSISFLGIEGESLVIESDNAGFAISAGAACSSRSTEPSHVLIAIGLEPEWIRGTIRISFGRFNTVNAAASLGKTLAGAVERLRSYRS